MQTYEIMKCRRLALGLTKEELAKITGLDVKLIEYYESGENVARYVGMDIKQALYEQFKNMDSVTHYKKRILELALEINKQDDADFMVQEIGHMLVELGKLQMEIFNQR